MSQFTTCNTCDAKYELMKSFEATEQAYRCSATVRADRTIVGHYGSTVADMEILDIVEDNAAIKEGMICDDCITKFLEDGSVKRAE